MADLAAAAIALPPGLALGSFLNVVAARMPRGASVVRPASACMSCGAAIAWYDNVPLVSYLRLRGRCRSCGAPIGLRYPAVEFATAFLVVGCVLAFGFTFDSLVAAFVCAVLVAVSAIDLEHRIIPNAIVLPASAIVLVANTLREPGVEWALAALGCSVFLFLAVLAYPVGMGMGDVKLALFLGAALGRTGPVALMVGLLAALVPVAFLFARHGSVARKMTIPFGPFLALGGVAALFAGDYLLGLYLETWS
jgi:leader peptidase (prepilin peptidase) / N-methyltransferase